MQYSLNRCSWDRSGTLGCSSIYQRGRFPVQGQSSNQYQTLTGGDPPHTGLNMSR